MAPLRWHQHILDWTILGTCSSLASESIQDVLSDAFNGRIATSEAVRPVGRAYCHHCPAPLIGADNRCSNTALFESVIPMSVVRMPLGGCSCQDLESFGCAVAVGGIGEAVFPSHFTPIALVTDDAVFAAEFAAALDLGALKDPVLGTMDGERSGSIHELSMTPMITTPKETDACECVLGAIDEMVTPER